MNPSPAKSSPLVVGLTGAIGSGKSQAAEVLRECGAEIIDADELARIVVQPGAEALQMIGRTFGMHFITSSGELDRSALGKLIFSNPAHRAQLEEILHPRIRTLYLSQLAAIKAQTKSQLIVYVVPLLFESRFSYPELDSIIVISAPRELSLERIIRRDGCSRELAEKKYDSQLPIEEKERRATHVIKNDGSLTEFRRKVQLLYQVLIEQKR